MNREEITIKHKQLEEIIELEKVCFSLGVSDNVILNFIEGFSRQDVCFEFSKKLLNKLIEMLDEELRLKKKEYEIE